jgi:hypothetical protein
MHSQEVRPISRQFFEQYLCRFQVGSAKTFSEPAIDLSEHSPCFFLLALLLPQPTQAHHGSQFERLCLLVLGEVDRLAKTGFSLLDSGF